jgi:hypothetical protein
VNETAAIRGSSARALPTTRPEPDTVCATPSGAPASRSASTRCQAEIGVALAGLTIIGSPARRAGASFRAGDAAGTFQGVIATVGPIGSCRVTVVKPGAAPSNERPSSAPASPA